MFGSKAYPDMIDKAVLKSSVNLHLNETKAVSGSVQCFKHDKLPSNKIFILNF